MIKKRRCGNCCHYFVNWKSEGLGICRVFDFKCNTDYGKNCSKWKGKKYNRLKNKNESKKSSTLQNILHCK
jgi:hypothetical protein